MIRLENLTVGYGGKTLIGNANANINGGRLTALIGRNGTGKSSLLRVIGGIDRPKCGTVSINGNDLQKMTSAERARTIAFVTTQRVRIANLRCIDVVGMGRMPYTDWIGRMSDRDKEIVASSLDVVEMGDYTYRTLDTMSDGECQRIMIARALAQQTPIILLDEPTSFLDVPNRHNICRLLQRLAHKQNKLVLFSTHELDIALDLCDDIILIDTPQLICEPTRKMIEIGVIDHCFGLEKKIGLQRM